MRSFCQARHIPSLIESSQLPNEVVPYLAAGYMRVSDRVWTQIRLPLLRCQCVHNDPDSLLLSSEEKCKYRYQQSESKDLHRVWFLGFCAPRYNYVKYKSYKYLYLKAPYFLLMYL